MKTVTYLPSAAGSFLKGLALLLSICFAGAFSAHGQTGAVPCPPNIDFSYANFTNWYCYTGASSTGIVGPVATGMTYSGPVSGRHTIMTGTGTDPIGGFPVVAPGGGVASVKIGNSSTGAECERIRYYVHVPVGFNNYSFDFRYAVCFEDPGHSPQDQPAFYVIGYDSATGTPLPCATLTYVAGAGLPGFTQVGGWWYLPWTNGSLNLSGQGGKTIIIEVTSLDCTLGGHAGYGYFDIISCGRFAAAVQTCNLATGTIQLIAPAGYQSYKWYTPTWTFVASGRTPNVTLPTTTSFFYCVLTPYNSNGCPDTIRTRNISNFNLTTAPKAVCNTLGRPIQLTSTASGGIGGFTYSWYDPTFTLTGTTSGTGGCCPVAQPTGAGYYVVTVSDSVGCFRRDTVRIENPTFSVNLGPDRTTCIGTPINLNPVVTPASPGYVYHWTPPANLSDSTILNPTFTPSAVGTITYVLRVDSSICAATDTFSIRTLPNSFTITDSALCQFAQFTPNLRGDTNFKYSFSPLFNVASTGTSNLASMYPRITADSTITYTVTARYPTCPDIVRTVTYRVEPQPVVNLGPDTVEKCLYQPLYLTANVTPTWFTDYTYTWRANDFIDNPNSPLITFSGRKDTTLRVTVRTPLGCRGRDSVFVHVYSGDFGKVTPDDTAICPRNKFKMTASGGVKYIWTPALYLSDTAGSTVYATPAATTDYTVYVIDKNKCIDTVPVHLQVFADASVNVPDSTVLYPGETYQINPTGNALYYSWFPTVGLSNSGIAAPLASPSVNTTYFVTATTEAGCVAVDSIHVIVKDEAVIGMPNAFSPGSEPNSTFSVAHRGIATLTYFRIYNRWGTKLFETTDLNRGWDGRFNGEPQPVGVYIYTVEGVTTKGNHFNKQGNVTLIR